MPCGEGTITLDEGFKDTVKDSAELQKRLTPSSVSPVAGIPCAAVSVPMGATTSTVGPLTGSDVLARDAIPSGTRTDADPIRSYSHRPTFKTSALIDDVHLAKCPRDILQSLCTAFPHSISLVSAAGSFLERTAFGDSASSAWQLCFRICLVYFGLIATSQSLQRHILGLLSVAVRLCGGAITTMIKLAEVCGKLFGMLKASRAVKPLIEGFCRGYRSEAVRVPWR